MIQEALDRVQFVARAKVERDGGPAMLKKQPEPRL